MGTRVLNFKRENPVHWAALGFLFYGAYIVDIIPIKFMSIQNSRIGRILGSKFFNSPNPALNAGLKSTPESNRYSVLFLYVGHTLFPAAHKHNPSTQNNPDPN